MFCNDHRESREMLVQINGMQAEVMDLLLKYMYTARVTITSDNVQLLLEASNLFQVSFFNSKMYRGVTSLEALL